MVSIILVGDVLIVRIMKEVVDRMVKKNKKLATIQARVKRNRKKMQKGTVKGKPTKSKSKRA